uniref:Fatty acid synthase n=1 Tax=Anisakis simplex TaxID=6269 RepID=A0A0M3K7N6_ANISI
LNEIRERIKQILSRFIDLEHQQDEKTFIWLGLDSLKMATFEVNLKTEFANDFNVPYGCTFRYRTVSMLTEYFESLKHLKSLADGNEHSGSDSNTKKFDAIATGNDNGCKYEENNNFIALDFDKIDRKLRRLILKGGLIPLSASQSRLIFMAKLEPENDAQFIEKVTLKLTNPNIKRLATALNQLVSHQTILRTSCTSSSQVVLSLSESYFAVRVMDDSQYRMRSSEQLTVFDASVLRILLQKTEAGFILHIIQHHIATDGTSIAILMRELKNAYEGEKIEKLSFHYAHFALLEQLQLSDQTYVKNRQKFWTEQFKNFETEKLLTDKPRQSMQTYNGAVATYQLSGSELAKVKDIASQLEVTQFATLLSIYHLFLCVVCDRSDYCTGTAISQRNNAYTEKLAGCLVNILPIRLQVDSSKSVGEMIIDSANLINECVQNQLPFERILNLLNLTRDTSSSPLFQILVVMDNIINASDLQNESSQSGDLSLQAELIEEQSKFVKYDQIWYFRSIGDCLTIEVEYNTDLFYKSSVEKTIREFVHTVRIAAGSLHDSISSIELQTNEQKLQNYTDRLKNRNDFPMNLAAGDIFQSQLSMSASTNCVVFNRLLYSSIFLNRRSNCLAHVINTKFVEHWGTISRSDTPIILLMNRSVEMILFVMSLWKCGFTVVPLSIDWPERRYHDTVKSLPYSTIITADDFIESTQLPSGCLYINISTVLKDSTTCSTKAIRTKQSVYDIGYITYTSGSTGLGKGVLSEMIGLNNLAANYTRCLALNSESVVYQLANHSFDIFFADLVEAFTNGATLQLARRRVPDPKEMHSVTHAYVMPAYLSQLDDTKMNQFEKLEAVNFGGDSIDTNVLANAIDRGICLYHQYGTTETAVLSTMRKMRLFDTNNSVGHPMRNIHFTIRNSNMKLIPPTRRGICCIDGVGVSDLLESDVSGQFKFFGRADRQVKIRGQIVDMNELEAALSSISTVESCIITSRMQKKSCILIAHCIVNDQYKNSTSEQIQNLLRDILVDKIPNFMIPSYFHFIDSFPLTSNGKIDRQRLDADVPMIENSRKTDDQTLLQMTDSEKKVCQIFGDVLEVDSVTLKDSFFALGGDSLKALLAIGRIEDELSIEIPLKSVFHCKTFREILDSQIKRCHEPKGVDSESSQQLIRSEGISERFWLDANGIPLSFAQQTLWFVENYEQSTPLSYVLRSKIRLRGKVHLKALNATINFVMRQHQILRTIFVVRRGSVSQLVTSLTESYVSLIEGDPCNVDGGCYDLQNSPPLKIFMQRHRNGIDLHLYLHHILTDAQTYTIILKHLIEIYEWIVLDDINTSFSSIRSTIQQSYALYSYQQRKSFNNRMDGEMQQWVEQLRNEEALEIPADSIRPKVFETRGRILRVDINIKRDEIGGFCSRYNCTQFTYLLAAYALVMRTLSGQRRFVIGTPTANRSAKFMDTAGFFVNSVPLIIDTEFVNLVEFIESLKQMFSTALQHQHVPFELIVERLNPIRDPSRAPLFQHSIVLHTETNYKFTKLKELTIDMEDIDSEEAKYDQTWFFELGDSKLKLKLDYCSALFSRSTVETYIKMFIAVAKSLLRATSFDEINYVIESELIKEIRKNHRCDTPRITLSRIFEAQSHRSPTNEMLMWFEGDHNRSITFEEAHKFVFYLAGRMQQEAICQFGAPLTSDDCLSILSSENFLSVLSIFAVQLSGCCYCPIDSTNPSKRVDFIRHDSRSKLILICDETYPSVREKLVVNVVEELRKWRRIGNNHKMRGKFNRTNISDLAYIIYTSGSTGQPKGVCVEHRSLVNVLEHTTRFYCIKESQRFYQFTKLSFDASLANTFGSTLNGATLCLRDENMNPFEDICRSLPLDVLHMTPIVLKQFSDAEITELKPKLALWSVGGEQLLDLDANKVIEKGIPMIQVYGPTEATVFQTTIKMKMNTPQSSNIGPTISNMFGYVVGDQEQLLPSGVRGEFYMVGENIARDYMNADRIEGVNFTSNKLQTRDENAKGTNSRAYRSGDIAMRLPSSEMIYCGRRDTQIKLKGYRVELGEIEAAVSCLDGVRSCVTIAKNDRLVSFYTGECRLSEHEQLEQLSEVLPHYMIPSKLIRLQQFPLTQNSKIDRKALESYCGQEDGVDLRILQKNDDIQDILRRIWSEALKKDNINVQDNFFALGGHSLMATEICFRIQETLQMKCPTRFIFENQTIEKLAKYLSAEAVTDCAREQHSPESHVENLAGLKHISIGPGKQNPRNERETSKEQTFADVGNSRDSSTGKPRTSDRKSNSKRSNILMPLRCCDLQNPILHIYYNNPEGLYLRAYETGFRIRLNSIEVPLLQMCLNRILMRHDALRTSFYCDSKEYFQEIHSASECYLAIRYSDPSGSNLFVPSPFKSIPVLSFLEKTNGSVEFILKMSHLITDGRSMQVIAQELHTAYFKRRLLPKNKATYAGFTEMYSEKIEQLKETNEVHWRNIAASIDGSLLETDKPRKSVSRKNECSDFATMLTAFAVVMSRRFPERSKFVIGCPVDMRENPLENSVGFHLHQ